MSPEEFRVDDDKKRSRMLTILLVRLFFLLVILFTVIIFQSNQPEFINFGVLFPVFLLVGGSFFIQLIFLLTFEKARRSQSALAALFILDALFVTGLIYYTGINQSIFLFLYLVNIMLCGFVFHRRGSLILALWTSMLFSLLLIIGPELRGQTLYFAVGVNNVAFFAVALLSGYLSEQLNFMGTELRERSRDIAALRNLNQLIIQNMSTGLITVDPNGNIVQVNTAGCELLRLNESELIGRPLGEMMSTVNEKLRLQVQAGEVVETDHFDVQFENAAGIKMTLGVGISPLLDPERGLSGFIVTFQDMTRIRRLEEAMRQSEKLAAVGQLAAGIAHEIRNPLASISGSVQMLESVFEGSGSEEKKLLRIMVREIDRLNAMISDFLNFVRPDQTELRPHRVDNLVKEIIDLVRVNRQLNPAIRYDLTLNSSTLVAIDVDKLKQALLNIVINACQAMDNTSTPVLTVETTDHDGRVSLLIRDNGVGMDSKTLKRIFEPFLTTKPKGTGLGLAVTHKILQSHSAKVFVESTLGVGTEFLIEFPALSASETNEEHVSPKEAKSLADSESARNHKKVRQRGHG